jgi:niacin transporter
MGVVLPFAFHSFPLGGRIFLPMHIPVFIAGLVLGPVSGLIVGLGAPIVSALLTGRPTVFYMIPMVFELSAYGVVAGLARPWVASLLSRRLARRTDVPTAPSRLVSVAIALAVAMVVGRAVWLAAVVWLAPVIGIRARTVAMAVGALGAGWIGMIVQLGLIPPIVRAIERHRRS